MPPKKGGKAGAKGKSKAKEPQAEPATDGLTATVQDDAPKVDESKPEEAQVDEPKAEEPVAEAAPVTEEKAATEAQSEAQAEPEPATEAQPAAEAAPEPESAPKGKKTNKRKAPAAEEAKPAQAVAEPAAHEEAALEAKKPSKKRKSDAPPPREGSRKSGRGASKAQPSTEQLLNYLLSNEAADLCRPDDEAQELKDRGSDLKTYSSSPLSPFEELICAVVLSRPISHRLGMRAIRTILNDPYSFTTPKAIIGAGKEKRHQALVDAKTQHKEKTAEQIGLIADVVAHKFGKDDTDTSMDKLRDQASKGWDMERDLLQENIKGVGKTGLDIFFRRVQWLWPEAFPFVDERSSRGIEKLGLPKNPDELAKTLDRYWAKLDTSSLDSGDKETKKRRAFVIICERATGADLEGKSDAILEAAASS